MHAWADSRGTRRALAHKGRNRGSACGFYIEFTGEGVSCARVIADVCSSCVRTSSPRSYASPHLSASTTKKGPSEQARAKIRGSAGAV